MEKCMSRQALPVIIVTLVGAIPGLAMEQLTDDEMHTVRGGVTQVERKCYQTYCPDPTTYPATATYLCAPETKTNPSTGQQQAVCVSKDRNTVWGCTDEGATWNDTCNKDFDPKAACTIISVYDRVNGACVRDCGSSTTHRYLWGGFETYNSASDCVDGKRV